MKAGKLVLLMCIFAAVVCFGVFANAGGGISNIGEASDAEDCRIFSPLALFRENARNSAGLSADGDLKSVLVTNAASDNLKRVINLINSTVYATPEPEPQTDYAALEELLWNKMSEYEGDWSLYFKEMNDNAEISINSHRVYSASLIKLYVAQAVYTKICEGSLSDSVDTEELLRRMITWSDNDAWRSLASLMGGGNYTAGMEYVTLIAQATGFSDSGRFDNDERSNFNFTSVNDCGHYLEMLLAGTIVNADYSSRILELMKEQQVTHKIPAGVPEGVTVANKTGELDYMQGDAAIVFAPSGTYILVVIANDVSDYACTGITELSRITYEFLNN